MSKEKRIKSWFHKPERGIAKIFIQPSRSDSKIYFGETQAMNDSDVEIIVTSEANARKLLVYLEN